MISQHFLIYVVVKTCIIFVYRVPILEGQLVSWNHNFYGSSLKFSGNFFSSNVRMITVLTLAILIVDHFTWNWKSYTVLEIIQKIIIQKHDSLFFQIKHFCKLGGIRGRFHNAGHTDSSVAPNFWEAFSGVKVGCKRKAQMNRAISMKCAHLSTFTIFVSSCQNGLVFEWWSEKWTEKKPDYGPKCPVFKWSAKSCDFTIWNPNTQILSGIQMITVYKRPYNTL